MSMKKQLIFFLIALVIFLSELQAGAFRLSEVGTADVGVANAGSAAVARDAATAYFNPAGMTFLDCNQLVLGAHAL